LQISSASKKEFKKEIIQAFELFANKFCKYTNKKGRKGEKAE